MTSPPEPESGADPGLRLFVRVGDEVRGPYDLGRLRQLAEVEVITPATEATEARTGPWARLDADETIAAAIFPARRRLGFREAEFARDNTGSAAPVDLREVIAAANAPPPPSLAGRTIARTTAAEAGMTREAEGEVSQMVRAVGEKEAQFAPPPPPPKPWRPSRRLVLVGGIGLAGNAVLAAIPVVYDALGDQASMTMLLGWAGLFNAGLLILFKSVPKV